MTDFKPKFVMKHYKGNVHAQFLGANDAKRMMEALRNDPDPRPQTWYHFEDMDGNRVETFEEKHYGHVYPIMAAIAKADAAKKAARSDDR